MTTFESLLNSRKVSSNIYLFIGRERDLELLKLQNDKWLLRFIRGKRCKEHVSLFQEWAAALQFPYYFGENWDAFDECINDLNWLQASGYIFMVTNIDKVLIEDTEKFPLFIDLLRDAVKTWSAEVSEGKSWRWTSKSVPFYVIFHSESSQKSATLHKLNKWKEEIVIKELPRLDNIN